MYLQTFKKRLDLNLKFSDHFPTDYDYVVYTDGACSGNPGPGGIGILIINKEGEVYENSKAYENATNNQMELESAIQALKSLPSGVRVLLRTDSEYISKAFSQGWLLNWIKNNWRSSSRKAVKNKELWQQLLGEVQKRDVSVEWIKGHDKDMFNKEADRLARLAIKNLNIK